MIVNQIKSFNILIKPIMNWILKKYLIHKILSVKFMRAQIVNRKYTNPQATWGGTQS